MDQDHPRYIGAWWIGFIVIAIFLMIFSPMLTLFPSRLPAENETDAKKVERELSEDEKPQSVMDWWKEFIGIVTRFYCINVLNYSLTRKQTTYKTFSYF